MPYLRRLVLLLTLSTSLLLVTVHLLHFSRPRHHDPPLHPVISKEQAEKDFSYLKQYDHAIKPDDLAVPSRDYVNKMIWGKEPAVPPKEEVQVPEQKDPNPMPTLKQDVQKEATPVSKPAEQDVSKTKLRLDQRPQLPASKIAPPNATAWHKDKNLWKVVDALNG